MLFCCPSDMSHKEADGLLMNIRSITGLFRALPLLYYILYITSSDDELTTLAPFQPPQSQRRRSNDAKSG